MKIVELKNRHIAAWQREIRAMKPGDVNNIAQLPAAWFYEITIQAAFNAGWMVEVTQEQVSDLTFKESEKWATELLAAYNATQDVDPN